MTDDTGNAESRKKRVGVGYETCDVCKGDFPIVEIEQHHVMYSPEVTIPVCKSCHTAIHADNGRYDSLNPRTNGHLHVSEQHDTGFFERDGMKFNILTDYGNTK